MAELFFGAPAKDIPVSSQVEFGVFINTEDQILNAFKGEIIINDGEGEMGEVKNIALNNSIVSLWIEEPVIEDGGAAISFAGITPGGFRGGDGLLFTFVVKTDDEVGQLVIKGGDLQILAHDGLGTLVPLTVSPLFLNTYQANDVSRSPGNKFFSLESGILYSSLFFISFLIGVFLWRRKKSSRF